MLEQLSAAMPLHHLPIMVLGSGRTTLADKFSCILYAFLLESGSPYKAFHSYTSGMRVLTTDFGVEFGLPSVQPIKVRHLFPWLSEAAPPESDLQDDEDFQHVEEGDPGLDLEVSLSHAIPAPGLLHIIHNGSNDLVKVLESLGTTVSQLKEVSRLLAHPPSRERLIATCFISPVARQFKGQLLKFSAKVYEARWGSVAFACEEVQELEKPLRRFWDREAYSGRSAPAPDVENNDGKGVQINKVDDAVCSPMFWAKLCTMNYLFAMVRDVLAWAESCPCHGDLDHCAAPSWLRRRWEKCPMRGARLPELAAGDFFAKFEQLYELPAAQLLLSLPTDISAACRSECLLDLDRGRSHLLFVLTLKLSSFMEPPCLLLAAAHHNVAASMRAVRTCLASACQHTLVQQLQTEPVKSEALEYLDGEDLQGLTSLVSFIAQLRFGFSSERRVEGGHSRVNLRGLLARSRSEAFDSLGLRIQEIKGHMQKDKEFLPALLDCLDAARTPRRLIAELGLSSHPSCKLAVHGWDPIYRKIVYHSDPHSMYHAQRPALQLAPQPPAPKPSAAETHALQPANDEAEDEQAGTFS